MIFSDLASPAEALAERLGHLHGFAQAGNRYPLFSIMLYPVRTRPAFASRGVKPAAIASDSLP